MDFQNLKNDFDLMIRQGQITTVQQALENIKPSAIPRSLLADYGDIARRVRLENWGLRLLRPVIRPKEPLFPAVTPEELCAYAGLLIKIGALPEAKEILESLDEEKTANVLLLKSQIHFSEWDYKKAIPLLKKVLKLNLLNSYQRGIAQVNLIGALVYQKRFEEAKKWMSFTKEECLKNKWDLLYGNLLEISAQMSVMEQDWEAANKLLSEASSHSGQHSFYSIYIEKWLLLSQLFQSQKESLQFDKILQEITELKTKALSLSSWEVLRDLDFQQALFLNHQNLLLNVYFGTPHAEYKRKIELIFKRNHWKIPESYVRKLSPEETHRIFDIEKAPEVNDPSKEALKPGQMLYRLFHILTRDFYKPLFLGEIFSNLFPGEYYNPDSSAERVAQAIKKLRKWFEENNLPLDVLVKNGQYSLKATGPIALKVSKNTKSAEELKSTGFESQIDLLKKKWPYQSFSTAMAAKELNISATATRILLRKALEEKEIYSSGAGRNTLYRFSK